MGRNMTGGISNWEPIFVYGEVKLDTDYIYESVQKARMNEYKKMPVNHPCPKPKSLYEQILRYIKPFPKTILDCFVGSGTVIEVAIDQKIDWIGFEIETAYKPCLDARINRAAKRVATHSINLETFFG